MKEEKSLVEIIGDNIKYLYSVGSISFSDRVGIKNICRCFTNHPITKKDIVKLKQVFEKLKLEPYKSGEYPVPPNLEQYKYLKYVDYADDFTSFNIKLLDEQLTMNRVESVLFQEAEDMYQKCFNDTENKGEK